MVLGCTGGVTVPKCAGCCKCLEQSRSAPIVTGLDKIDLTTFACS